ncbi:MAG: tRNA 2-thiouridine(34) synthase MnmA [Oscillospiraceae bacterium]
MQNKSVMIGMSGGVDSSVAALLLMQNDYDVGGATLSLHGENDNSCCSNKDIVDAKNVCEKLKIPHYVFDFHEEFKQNVINNFINEYNCGRTPNPCIDCNRTIKFRQMLDKAIEFNYNYIATGHYAVCAFESASERYILSRPKDLSKDQTYVLYSLTQEQLSHTIFPLGNITKAQVREIAADNNLVNAKKPDSQDICFVPDGNYASFIENETGKSAVQGDFVNLNGEKIGQHGGIIKYTIGQRKGLGVAFGKPQFVLDKCAEDNIIMLGDEEHLFQKNVTVSNCNFIAIDDLKSTMNVYAKLRYSQQAQKATIRRDDNGDVLIEFESPQRAVTPGQAAVFYADDVVVGGGTIVKQKGK